MTREQAQLIVDDIDIVDLLKDEDVEPYWRANKELAKAYRALIAMAVVVEGP